MATKKLVSAKIPLFAIDSASALTKAVAGIKKLGVQDSARVIISGNAELIQKAVSSLVKLSQTNMVSVGVSLRGNSKV